MERIESFVEAGWLAEAPASDEEVIGLWSKALGAWADAHVAANTDEARVIRTYDAGRLAATAVVRAHNYRVRAQNHHEMTLRTAGALGSDELRRALNEFDRVRRLRSEAEYGWEPAAESPLPHAIALVRRILSLCARELALARPPLAERFDPPE